MLPAGGPGCSAPLPPSQTLPSLLARLVEGQNVRRRRAAIGFAAGAIGLHIFQRLRAMDDPDIVVLVHVQPDGVAHQPMVGQRLGPERIDLEFRHHDVAGILGLRGRRRGQKARQGKKTGAQQAARTNEQRHESSRNIYLSYPDGPEALFLSCDRPKKTAA
ncbi:MAG: hypothetical protein J0H61_08850 [Alphaproteobacteria bacterium]|nr:hypothetical protein [Alphaproteobacteria bacterium]